MYAHAPPPGNVLEEKIKTILLSINTSDIWSDKRDGGLWWE
jgi:hypothetical protein